MGISVIILGIALAAGARTASGCGAASLAGAAAAIGGSIVEAGALILGIIVGLDRADIVAVLDFLGFQRSRRRRDRLVQGVGPGVAQRSARHRITGHRPAPQLKASEARRYGFQ